VLWESFFKTNPVIDNLIYSKSHLCVPYESRNLFCPHRVFIFLEQHLPFTVSSPLKQPVGSSSLRLSWMLLCCCAAAVLPCSPLHSESK
jgi:hypothetical protein